MNKIFLFVLAVLFFNASMGIIIPWNVGYVSENDTIELQYTNNTKNTLTIAGYDLSTDNFSLIHYPDAIEANQQGRFEIVINKNLVRGYFSSKLVFYTQKEDLVLNISGRIGAPIDSGIFKSRPNPAASYCEALGYRYEKQIDKRGNEVGICILPNGQKVNAWDFYKGKVGKQFSYCAKNGLQTVSHRKHTKGYTSTCTACLEEKKSSNKNAGIGFDTISMIDLMIEKNEIDLFFPGKGKEQKVKVQKNTTKPDPMPVKSDLPLSYDWRNIGGDSYVGPIRNQGGCGACYAFSALAAAETAYNLDNGKVNGNCIDLSESYVIWCLSRIGDYGDHFFGCDGANYEYMEMEALTTDGVCTEADFPYAQSDPCAGTCVQCQQETVYLFDDWGRIDCSDYEAIKQAIYQYGVINAAVYVNSSFDGYDSGVYYDSQNNCENDCAYVTTNHGIALVGWGHDPANGELYWILRNSWGTNWGEDGYMRINANSARVSCAATYIDYKSISVQNQAATNITGSSAILNASIDNIDEDGNGWFTYGYTESLLDQNSSSSSFSSGSSVAFSVNVNGLLSQTTYYHKPHIQTTNYSSSGEVLAFTTTGSTIAPSLTNIEESLSGLTATISFMVNPHGATTDVELWISTDGSNFSIFDQMEILTATNFQEKSFDVLPLLGATTYYYYLKASNSAGNTQSTTFQFTSNNVFTVSFQSNDNGTTAPSMQQYVVDGDSLLVEAIPNIEWVMYQWLISSGSGSFSDQYADKTFFKPTSDATLNVTYKEHSLLESFESAAFPPESWSQEYVQYAIDWFRESGTKKGEPDHAAHNDFNASMSVTSFSSSITKLITPTIDLRTRENNKLCFWYVSRNWAPDIDEMKVYYRIDPTQNWIEIPEAEQTNEVYDWTFFEFDLPTSSAQTQIAFEANCHYGYGVGLDKVFIYGDFKCIVPEIAESMQIDNIKSTQADVSGTIVNDFNCQVNQIGAIWSLIPSFNPVDEGIDIGISEPFGIGSFSIELNDLPGGSTIYAYGYAENNAGRIFTNLHEFATLCNPPEAFDPVEVNAESAIINWSRSKGATDYLLDIATDASFSNFFNNYQNYEINDSVRHINGLTINETYYFRVRAKNTSGTSEYSNTITFTAVCTPVSITNDVVAVYLNHEGDIEITASMLSPIINAPCGIDEMEITPPVFDCNGVGLQNATLNITDLGGNFISKNIKLMVYDTMAPIIELTSVYLTLENGTATLDPESIILSISDNCQVIDTLISQTQFTCNDIGENNLLISAIDVNGNRSQSTITIVVKDTEKPDAQANNIDLYLNENGLASLTPEMVDNGSSDNCGIKEKNLGITEFNCEYIGTNYVQFKVIDFSNNIDSVEIEVSVLDTIKPVAVTKNLEVFLDDDGIKEITPLMVGSESYDNCGIRSISINIEEVNCTQLGNLPCTLTVTDNSGNVQQAQSLLTVSDTIKPTILDHTFTLFLDETGSTFLSQDSIESICFDNCGLQKVEASQMEFNCSTNEQQITITAYDIAQNSKTKTVYVEIKDTIKPEILSINLNPVFYLNSNGIVSVDPLTIEHQVRDNCSITNSSIAPNYFDCSHLGNMPALFKVSDQQGNTSYANLEISIVDTISPLIPDFEQNIYLNEKGIATINWETLKNNISDNCDLRDTNIEKTQLSCNELGINKIKVDATDYSGNKATKYWQFTLIDTIKPDFSIAASSISLDENGMAVVDPYSLVESLLDNCEVTTLESNPKQFSCNEIGMQQISITAIDNAGNQKSKSAYINIVDELPPVIHVSTKTFYLDEFGTLSVQPEDFDNGTSDNCSLQSISISKSEFSCDNIGTLTIDFIAKDQFNNESIQSINFELIDTISPVVNVDNIELYLNDNGEVNLTYEQLSYTQTDNCDNFNNPQLDESLFSTSNLGNNSNAFRVEDFSGNIGVSNFTTYITSDHNFFETFNVNGQDSSRINRQQNKVVVFIPMGMPKAKLTTSFEVSPGATCDIISGTTINLVDPIECSVIAHDGSTANWVIEVIYSPGENEMPLFAYPNPTSGLLTLELPQPNCTIKLFDSKGKYIESFDSQIKFMQIDVSTLLSGTYIVKIFNFNDEYLTERKIIKW